MNNLTFFIKLVSARIAKTWEFVDGEKLRNDWFLKRPWVQQQKTSRMRGRINKWNSKFEWWNREIKENRGTSYEQREI